MAQSVSSGIRYRVCTWCHRFFPAYMAGRPKGRRGLGVRQQCPHCKEWGTTLLVPRGAAGALLQCQHGDYKLEMISDEDIIVTPSPPNALTESIRRNQGALMEILEKTNYELDFSG